MVRINNIGHDVLTDLLCSHFSHLIGTLPCTSASLTSCISIVLSILNILMHSFDHYAACWVTLKAFPCHMSFWSICSCHGPCPPVTCIIRITAVSSLGVYPHYACSAETVHVCMSDSFISPTHTAWPSFNVGAPNGRIRGIRFRISLLRPPILRA